MTCVGCREIRGESGDTRHGYGILNDPLNDIARPPSRAMGGLVIEA